MSYVQLIYNPMAGQRTFKSRLDYFIDVFQRSGCEVRIRRTMSDKDFSTFFVDRDFTGCEAVIVAGGDGSINHVVNAMRKNNVKVPLGVIPAGTANDFAKHLGMPDNFQDGINMLAKRETEKLDMGLVNDQHFINVCSGGLLINISHNIEPELKNTFGKLAYYIKGVQQLPKFRRLKFRIHANDHVYDEDLYLFLVLNGSSAGGFNRIGEYASMKDGMLDFVGLRAGSVNNIASIFGKIIIGEHLEDPNVLYFKSKHIVVESLEDSKVPTDIDGEVGPDYPLDIRVMPSELEVIVDKL